jgi:UDP-N-acetyl-D-mannosaminuronic acid transferase (WecB/TagA/CpsF family)
VPVTVPELKKKALMSKDIFTLFDIPIRCLTFEESLDAIFLASGENSQRVFFATSYSLVKAHQDKAHKRALQLAEFCLQSGHGILLAAHFLHNKAVPYPFEPEQWLCHFLDLLAERSSVPASIFCIGSEQSDIDALPTFIAKRWPRIRLCGTYKTWTAEEEEEVVKRIEQTAPTILLVSREIPEGERFICRHWHRFKNAGIKVALSGEEVVEKMIGTFPCTTRLLRALHIESLMHAMLRPKVFFQRYVFGGCYFAYLLLKTKWQR